MPNKDSGHASTRNAADHSAPKRNEGNAVSTITPADQLSEVGACSDAVQFVRQGKFCTLQAAWDACERGDWMLWWAGKKSGEPKSDARKKLVLAACECAREVLPIFEKRRPGDVSRTVQDRR